MLSWPDGTCLFADLLLAAWQRFTIAAVTYLSSHICITSSSLPSPIVDFCVPADEIVVDNGKMTETLNSVGKDTLVSRRKRQCFLAHLFLFGGFLIPLEERYKLVVDRQERSMCNVSPLSIYITQSHAFIQYIYRNRIISATVMWRSCTKSNVK